ncbi:MAG: hypothetical protein ACRDTD_32205, partial [Pseudonocardiaceae bacterium]
VAPLSAEPWRNHTATIDSLEDQARAVGSLVASLRLTTATGGVTLSTEQDAEALARLVRRYGVASEVFRHGSPGSPPTTLPIADPRIVRVGGKDAARTTASTPHDDTTPEQDRDALRGRRYVAELLATHRGEEALPEIAERLALRLAAGVPMGTVAAALEAAPPKVREATANRFRELPPGMPSDLTDPRLRGDAIRVERAARETLAELAELAELREALSAGPLSEEQHVRLRVLAKKLDWGAHSMYRAKQRATEDLIRVEYLTTPRAKQGSVPNKQSRLLLRRDDGSYTREWLSNRDEYPTVIAVRPFGKYIGAGLLTFEELNFVDAPRGMILECGVPERASYESAAYQEEHGGQQIVEA